MSLWGKLALSLSGLSLVITMLVFWILGSWYSFLYVFLSVCFISLAGALILDFRLYLSFFTIRTAKKGMSIGMSILTALLLCFSVAYLSLSFDKSFDVTEEKINSLAPQTQQVLDSLKENMHLKVFYKGGQALQAKEQIKRRLMLYKKYSDRLKIQYHDAYLENKLAQEYLSQQSDKTKSSIFMFAEYKGKKVSVLSPYNEEKITTAIINAAKRDQKTVYFLSGHGERSVEDKGPEGIQDFYSALSASAFKVKEWSFISDGPLPSDVSVLVIAGPERPYMEKEIEQLEEYMKKGGRLLLALDPDKKHKFDGFLKSYGITYRNRYVAVLSLSLQSAMMGMGPFSPLGRHFDKEHIITKSFSKNTAAVFHTASGLQAEDKDSADITELVKTDVQSLSVPGLSREDFKKGEKGPHILGLLLKQKPAESEKNSSKKDSKNQPSSILAVFGDSDFLSNQWFNNDHIVNRDLSMNVLSYLADESDLVSIRPKRLKATQIALKKFDQISIVLFSIVLPLVFFVLSFILWFKRRGA